MDLRKLLRWTRRWLLQRLRPPILAALGLLALLSLFLIWRARGLGEFDRNLELNVSADVIGSIVTIFVISPLISRAEYGRVREHRNLDYEWFTDHVARASVEVGILDTFSGLLAGRHANAFFRATRDAARRHARVRILLLDPDSLAARQRASELGNGA